MADTVIRVENLSKAALKGLPIRHQSGERYTALRDVLANGAKSLGSRLLRPATSQQPLASSHPPLATSEEFWALNDVSFEACPERSRRVKQGERVGDAQDKDWPQRGRQVDAAQDPEPDTLADEGAGSHQGAGGEFAGGGGSPGFPLGRERLSPRVNGAREYLPERRDFGHEPRGDPPPV
ncbi:MAG: hypothetical protein R3E79_32065 [Caldilineaceae bacterium]